MKTILFGIAIITLKVSKYHKCNDSHQIYLPLVCNFCLSAYIAAQLKGRCIGCLILFKTSPTLHFHISYRFKQRTDDIDEEEKAISSLFSTCDIPFNTLGVEMCVQGRSLFPCKSKYHNRCVEKWFECGYYNSTNSSSFSLRHIHIRSLYQIWVRFEGKGRKGSGGQLNR